MGTGFAADYSLYPLLAIFVNAFSSVTNLPLPLSVLWCLAPARIVVIPIVLLAFSRRYVSPQASIVAAFTYLAGPLLLHTANEGMAIIFVITFLYLAAARRPRVGGARVIVPLFALALALAHHFSSYVTFGWIIAILLTERVGNFLGRASTRYRIETSLMKYSLVIILALSILGWSVYVSYELAVGLAAGFASAVTQFLLGIRSEYVVPALTRFTSLELVVIGACQFLLALTTFYGLWRYVRGRRILSAVILGGFLFAGLLVVLGITLRNTEMYYLFNRVFEFSYVGFVPLSALCLVDRKFRKAISPFVLIVFAVTGSLVMTFSPRMYYYEPLSTTYLGPVTTEEFYAGTWFSVYRGRSDLVYGDRRAYEIMGGFGRSEVDFENAPMVFENLSRDNTLSETLRTDNAHYIVIHRWMFSYPTLELGSALDYQRNKDFSTVPWLFRVYDDGSYWIYWAELSSSQ
jgi:hypothetical protein